MPAAVPFLRKDSKKEDSAADPEDRADPARGWAENQRIPRKRLEDF